MRKDLDRFLILLVLASALAVVVFRAIEDRMIAALLAGTGFLAVEAFIVLKTMRWPNRFRTFTYYASRINLWLFALPMLIVRLRFWGHDFSELHFLQLSGPQFHRISEWAYLALVMAVVLDRLICRLALNRSKRASEIPAQDAHSSHKP